MPKAPRTPTRRAAPQTGSDVEARMTAICLAFPGAQVEIKWGKPHFVVAEKIFASCGEADGRASLGMKLEKPHAADLIARDRRFKPAPYVGKHGWVEMDVSGPVDWEQVRALVAESYALIAPKASSAKRSPAAARPRAKRR